jgi:hypothetical protein
VDITGRNYTSEYDINVRSTPRVARYQMRVIYGWEARTSMLAVASRWSRLMIARRISMETAVVGRSMI